MPYAAKITDSLSPDRLYHWLTVGYTHVVCYTKPVDSQYQSSCYFASCGTDKQLEQSKINLEKQGMKNVSIIQL
jgi:hypothetical protein